MNKEIRGQAIPATQVYIPSDAPNADEPQQGAPGTPWTDTAIAAASPGYAFTPEQLHSIADKWQSLAERYRHAKRTAQQIAIVEGPGNEYASINNAAKIRESGMALMSALDERVSYCETMARKFHEALDAYRRAEDGATAQIDPKGQF